MREKASERSDDPTPVSHPPVLEAPDVPMLLTASERLEKIDLEAIPFQEATAQAYAELGGDCIMIHDPGPTLLKGIAEIWGMGNLFGPHITVNARCLEGDVGMSLTDVWFGVGSHFRSVIESEIGMEGVPK